VNWNKIETDFNRDGDDSDSLGEDDYIRIHWKGGEKYPRSPFLWFCVLVITSFIPT